MTVKAVKDFLVGALVGIMSMMPGASGGIIAVIFGIYERLIADIANIRSKLLKDLRFIVPVGLGMVVGLLVCAVGIDALLQNWEIPLMFFFAALIVFQIPDIYRLCDGRGEDNGISGWNVAACVVGLAVMVAFLFLGSTDSDISLAELDAVDIVLLFIVGILIALSKIVPGLSGAAILLAIGLYTPLMDLVGSMDMSVLMERIAALVPIGLGLIAGVLGLSRIVDYLFRTHRRSAYWCIMGITVGSVVTVVVQALQGMESGMVPATIVCIAAGLVFGYVLSRVSSRYAEETMETEPA